MSIRIGSNIQSLIAQRRLGSAAESFARVSERLASGQRINRASDDPAGLSIASSLRVDERVFSQAIRNVNDAISMVAIADGALASLQGIGERLRELAQQSSNGVYSNVQRSALNLEASAMVQEYNRIVSSVEFNDRRVFDPSASSVSIQVGAGPQATLDLTIGTTLFGAAAPVTVLSGTGAFHAGVTLNFGTNPNAVHAADVNGDGMLDIVNSDGAFGFSVSLGNGNGSFKARFSMPVSPGTNSVRTGDINGDGKLDVISSDGGVNTLSVFFGNGNGTFNARTSVPVGTSPQSAYAFDLNGDSKLDLLSGDAGGTVTVVLGNGNGTFNAPLTLTAGNFNQSALAADMNGDSKLDIVAIDAVFGTVLFLTGNGDGTFAARQSLYMGIQTTALQVLDIDGDGDLDIVGNDRALGQVRLRLGNGDGTYNDTSIYAAGANADYVQVTDFNGDGKLDVVTGDSGGSSMSVLLGNGNGTFTAKLSIALPANPTGVAAGDFDGDDVVDLVASHQSTGSITVLLGNSESTLVPGTSGSATIAAVDLSSQDGALSAIDQIDLIMNRVSAERGSLGAAESRLGVILNHIQTQRETYEIAYSRIMDVDVAQESSTLIQSQIMQQVASAVLAQANLQPDIVLRLLN